MGLSTSLCNEMGIPQLSFKKRSEKCAGTSPAGMFEYNR